MRLRRDPSGALELILTDMSPPDIERIATMVLREAGPVANTHIGGDAIGCAIGPGASLTARDLIAVIERGQKAPDRIVSEALARLYKVPSLDEDLPENATAEDAARRAAARLNRVLSARNLGDSARPDFSQSKLSKRMRSVNDQDQLVPIRLVGTFFALASPPLVHHDEQHRFFQEWMNCNQRRYAPINDSFFLPSPAPVTMSKHQVWHNGHLQRIPVDQSYFTYLAADMDEGYLEYGFNAGSPLRPEGNQVYYAKVVGGFVAFLRFVRDIAETFDSDPSAISVGLALRGTAGTSLQYIGNHGQSTEPPESNGLRWVRAATPGTDWTVEQVARNAAAELLEHWSYVGPGGLSTPEFTGGTYTGKFYRKYFQGEWC